MAIAEIHGKSPLSFSEDFLTADVFTAFRYLPADLGIAGFLHSIPGLGDRLPPPDESTTCTYHFWPMGQRNRREPDVLLELHIGDQIYHIVVEAKYQSGPSDKEMVEVESGDEIIRLGNQLADQLRDLHEGHYVVYSGTRRDERQTLSSDTKDRLLLYLTAHPLRPDAELERSAEAYPQAADRLFWGNWYQVYDYLSSLVEEDLPFPYSQIVEDLLVLLDLKQFASFHGFSDLPQLAVPQLSGSFWIDHRIDVADYHGISLPPDLIVVAEDGSFWRGYRDGDLEYSGIRPPEFQMEARDLSWRPYCGTTVTIRE